MRWRPRLAALLLTAAALAPAGAQRAQEMPASLIADQVTYDRETRILTASGNVEVLYQGRVLRADRIVYDERRNEIRAEGDLLLTDPAGVRRPPLRMHEVEGQVSRMAVTVRPDVEGAWTFEIQAWSHPLGTWLHDAAIKIRAGVDVELMFTEGVLLLERVLSEGDLDKDEKAVVKDAIKAYKDTKRPEEARFAPARVERLKGARGLRRRGGPGPP